MKNPLLHLLAICLLAITFQSCVKDKCEREVAYIKQIPVFLTFDEVRVDVSFEDTRVLENPGKIYYYNNHIFINEIREGIHIVDNNDPANPVNIGFIAIPGNVDIAIRNNILFADNYTDLLSIDITDMTNPQILDREENALPFYNITDDDTFLAYYEEQEVVQTIDCNNSRNLNPSSSSFETNASGFDFDSNLSDTSVGGGSGPQLANGIAGSLARFSLINEFLYIVDDRDMHIYDITNVNDLQSSALVTLGNGIETIFPYGNHLFIGSNTGMLIYDNTNPALPTFVSEFRHARACDPVFVKDEYAYVTLRDGTECATFDNQMEVVNISNLADPVLATTVKMENPHGLSIKENNLVVCEGDHGFKTFDITNPLLVGENMRANFESIKAYDVISIPSQSNVIMIIGKDGFFQFDVEDISQPRMISSILTGV